MQTSGTRTGTDSPQASNVTPRVSQKNLKGHAQEALETCRDR